MKSTAPKEATGRAARAIAAMVVLIATLDHVANLSDLLYKLVS